MTLEALVEEIRRHGEAELQATLASQQSEVSKITQERDRKVSEIRESSARATEIEVGREKAQRLAAAKLQSRKMLYEAREKRLEEGLQETRELLTSFTASAAYPNVLKRMVDAATGALGKQVRISGRAEDAAALSKVAGKSFDSTARPILGGLVAETPDGARRLNLSFDELLRLREDRVRELLS
jgi:vacuolar-type H+-ATPase subunit E/Vma4